MLNKKQYVKTEYITPLCLIVIPHLLTGYLICLQKSVSTRRKTISTVENQTTTLEQPSPISVLDDTFYSEDSPSPVKKTTMDFQGTASLLSINTS